MNPTFRGLCTSLALLILGGATVQAASEPVGELYAPPKPAAVQQRVLNWAREHGVTDKETLAKIDALWNQEGPTPNAEQVLVRTIQSFSLADPRTKEALEKLALPAESLVPPDVSPLLSAEKGSFYDANIRLYIARYLVHREMFDEALELLEVTNVKEVVDPASCLFFKACCEKRLLMKKEGIATIDLLLKNTEDVPLRYSTVATLMRYDLEAIEDESLDVVSWKMDDVQRRLKLARAGEKVQKVEGEVIALLDEIIKKLEAQQGGGGGGGGSGDGQNPSNQSGSPANDSTIKGSTAPGEVDKKTLKGLENWGNLDEKQRARVKNLISRDFPAHYRQAVEEYFKKLANREAGQR